MEDPSLSRLMHPLVLHQIALESSLRNRVIELQQTDVGIHHIKRKIKEEETKHFRVDENGILWFKDQLVVPKDRELRNQILSEAHSSKLSIHPGSSKMYEDLKPLFWWTKMKKEIAAFVARCDNYCRVKAVHMKAGLLQPLSIPGWKWEEVSMDFISGLPTSVKGYDSIWVIVDRLTKVARFIPVRTNYRPHQYAELYFEHIVRQYGVPRTIISDHGPPFIACFWECLHEKIGTHLVRSFAYHPQTAGQTERVNQILEDMLRACALSSKGSWVKWLPLAEFSYNNSYQESIKMALFEALYGRKCRTPLNWVESEERRYYGIDFVNEAEQQVRTIQQHLEAAQARQKIYADKRRKPIEFAVGDHVYIKVSPMKGVQRFGVEQKLAPRYVGPYRILERKGNVAYKVQLPVELRAIFPVSHISQLTKCLRVLEERVEVRDIKLKSDLVYEEKPIAVVDRKERVTRNRVVKFYKVLWSNHGEEDATWETEDYLKEVYKTFFENQ